MCGTLSAQTVHVSTTDRPPGVTLSHTHTWSVKVNEQLSFSQCLTVIGDSPALKAHMVPQNSCGTGRPRTQGAHPHIEG